MSTEKNSKKISMSEQTFITIRDQIVGGMYKIGDKLPSESELAAENGVNRLTVRLALQKLSTLGFIETRTGEGSFVTGCDYLHNISELSKFFMDDQFIDYVAEFRSTIELRSIELAVANATEEELDTLERSCEDYEYWQKQFRQLDDEETFAKLMEADYAFHRTLTELSHNRLYTYAYSMAKEPICRYISLIISERDERKKKMNASWDENMDSHRRLLTALRARDIRRCQRVFDDILDYYRT